MTNIRATHRIAARMPARTTRSKKVTGTPVMEDTNIETVPVVKTTAKTDPFAVLLKIFSDLQAEYELLEKEITQTKEAWNVEQKAHAKEIETRNVQEELDRKRNQETYEYETARKQKIAEDEFADKRTLWERELKDQQETLQKEKAELLELRKMVDGFETEREKTVSQAQETLRKELTFKFETERKSREQEIKAEKDILNLRIGNFTTENNRLNTEIETLKKALEEATRQVKEIAVKVIESGTKPQQNLTNDP